MQSARRFLRGIIDYAGLFPPASLAMEDAVRAYAGYRAGSDRDLLGRLIVPATRLEQLSDALKSIDGHSEPWRLSVIAGKDFEAACDASIAFNESMSDERGGVRAVCDAIEVVVADPEAAASVIGAPSDSFEVYLEVPVSEDPSPIIAAMAGARVAAKIRTGGVTADAFPSSRQVLRFLSECRAHDVPFKATAGLHHLVRSRYPLTYESDAPLGEMFGYLNLFLAAAAIDAEWEHEEVLAILEQTDPSRFRFDAEGAVVNGRRIPNETLLDARSRFALSFGSCSFTEPVSEARAVGLV